MFREETYKRQELQSKVTVKESSQAALQGKEEYGQADQVVEGSGECVKQ